MDEASGSLTSSMIDQEGEVSWKADDASETVVGMRLRVRLTSQASYSEVSDPSIVFTLDVHKSSMSVADGVSSEL